MSLSRPARFPLLKLPWLCIESVIKNWNVVDLIFFAMISKKTRRIVKIFKIPLNEVEVNLAYCYIKLGNPKNTWIFNHRSWFVDRYEHLRKGCLVLRQNEIPFYTIRTNDALETYTNGNEVIALKMVMEFLNEMFKCSVGRVSINNGNFPESGDVGVKSTVNLTIGNVYGYPQSQKLHLLLENLEVTGTCDLRGTKIENDFYVDPKLFKCRELVFGKRSAAWITREILLQFEVPRLSFYYCPFSVEAVVSFVTQWFYSNNKKLEYLYIDFQKHVSLDEFQTAELNPMPVSGKTPIPPPFRYIDFSGRLKIVGNDGIVATIQVIGSTFLFYIWHDQSAITQN
ncbi:unnamed protein product [Caenorhabditis brenneri]